MQVKECILALIKAENPVDIYQIYDELKIQTDLFEPQKYSMLSIEMQIEDALNELIAEGEINIQICAYQSGKIDIVFNLV